ncbi:UNVERIFIED_CONTAM: hypothetical protein FKN15_018962 [Acipenser sinensis]
MPGPAETPFLNPLLTYLAEPSEGSELEKAAYSLNKKQKILRLVGQWVSLYGALLKEDPIAMDFLERLTEGVQSDSRLTSMLREQLQDHRKTRISESSYQTSSPAQALNHLNWFTNLEERLGSCQPIRAQDKVLQKYFRPDHTFVSLMLPVNVSVQEVMSSLVNPGGNQVLVKMNSSGDKLQLKLDATGVHTALGLNERLFICTADQVDKLVKQEAVSESQPNPAPRYPELPKPSLALPRASKTRPRVTQSVPNPAPRYPELPKPSPTQSFPNPAPSYPELPKPSPAIVFFWASPSPDPAAVSHPPSPGSEQSLSLRSPLGIRLYVQNLRVIDNQRTLTQLSRTLEP